MTSKKIDISMISINGKKKVTGAHGIDLDTDEDIVQCDPDKLDMLVLPGGMPGTTNLIMKKADQEKRNAALSSVSLKAVCYPGFETEK